MSELNLQYLGKLRWRTDRLLPLVPESSLAFRYRTNKFSLGDLFRHIALVERDMFLAVAMDNKSVYCGCREEVMRGSSLREFYGQVRSDSGKILHELATRNLSKKCISPAGAEVSLSSWLRAMIEHEIHHRGQIYLYINMLGIETPPMFGLSEEELASQSSR